LLSGISGKHLSPRDKNGNSSREENVFWRFLQNKNTNVFYHVYLIGEKPWNVKNAGHVVD